LFDDNTIALLLDCLQSQPPLSVHNCVKNNSIWGYTKNAGLFQPNFGSNIENP